MHSLTSAYYPWHRVVYPLVLWYELVIFGHKHIKLIDMPFDLQVEIVMGLEEHFGISVEEETAQSIATVQDAADMIEKLIQKKN